MNRFDPRRPLCLLGLALIFAGCADREKLYTAPSTVLPNVERLMKTSGYWISRHPCPDKIVLTPKEIQRLNQDVKKSHDFTQFHTTTVKTIPGTDLATRLRDDLQKFRTRNLYEVDTRHAGPNFFRTVAETMAIDSVPDTIRPQFGLVTHFADQRLLPTDEPLYMIPGDIDFDELQNNGLDVGTPVTILHTSCDGHWVYTLSPQSHGWVKTENLALCAPELHRKYTDIASFVIVTSAKGEIHLNEGLTALYDYVRMGAVLPLAGKSASGVVRVTIPVRNPDGTAAERIAFLRTDDVHEGFLPYTPRTILRQAFELLNSPYGWGDAHGEQDCSRFIQEIFATVGIQMPRNSSEQATVGRLIAEFPKGTPDETKLQALAAQGIGGITLLRLDNHIMLYLGMVEGRPYAIHATWGYHQMIHSRDVVRVLNRVAVTDMSLGTGSPKGSLLQRLIRIRLVK